MNATAPQTRPTPAPGGPLRVTFLLKQSDFSGGVRVVRTYAERLAERGHRVTLVSCAQAPEPWRRRVRRAFSGGGWRPRPERLPGHLDGVALEHRVLPGGKPPTADQMPDADVLVTTWWETALWSKGWPPSKGAPVDLVQHDERMVGRPSRETRAGVERAWALPRPKVAVAEWIQRAMEAEGAGAVTVVPNGVDATLFHAPPRGKRAEPTVGYMHSHARFKGIDRIQEAIRLAREELPSLRVLAFGHADASTSDPGFPEGVTYRRQPPQDEIREIYAGCDAWLFGSRCEGFGLPILEAMACRTPVIGTPAGAAPELLGPDADGGSAGWLVPMEDAEAMAGAILRVAAMPEDRWRTLSDRAHARAGAADWERSTDAFEAVLRRAAAP